jgi:hypothetical protein
MSNTPPASSQDQWVDKEEEFMKLPMKRTTNFTLPHPSDSPLLKKRKKDLACNEGLLEGQFGRKALCHVIVNNNYSQNVGAKVDGFTFQFLRNNFVLPMNKGNEMGCFICENGALTIFSPTNEDIKILNNLLRFLMKKLNVNSETHTIVELEQDAMTLYSRPDRMSTFWNKDGKMISALPKLAFQGKVALKIMGLFFFQGKDPNAAPSVKLLHHLEQVQVLSEGNGEDDLLKSCMFK